MLNEYRCTRADLYRHRCLGQKDLSQRQGHYIVAKDEIDAILEMRRAFPLEVGFTATLWKENVR